MKPLSEVAPRLLVIQIHIQAVCEGLNFLLKKLKFIYSEKATKFCEIFSLLLTLCTVVKSKGKISQKFCGLLRIYELYQNMT